MRHRNPIVVLLRRATVLVALLALAGCSTVQRGLEGSPQPTVAPPVFAEGEHPSLWSDYSKRGRDALAAGQYGDAESFFSRALNISKTFRARDVRAQTSVRNLERLADVYWRDGRTGDFARVAEPLITEYERIRRSGRGTSLAILYYRLGQAHAEEGRDAEASAELERAIDLFTAAEGPNHEALSVVHQEAGELLLGQDRADDAARHFERALEVLQAQVPQNENDIAQASVVLARARTKQGRPRSAEMLLQDALIVHTKIDPDGIYEATTSNALAWFYVEQDRADEALPLARRSVEILEAGTFDPGYLATSLDTLGMALLAVSDDSTEAALTLMRAVDLSEESEVLTQSDRDDIAGHLAQARE